MSFIPFPHGAKAVVHFHNSQGGWNNILWFLKFEYSDEDLLSLAATLDAYLGSALAPYMCDDASYDYVQVYDMRSIDGAVKMVDTGADTGAVTGEMTPVQSSVVTTLRTGFRGRSARGRIYWTGFAESNFTGTAWSATLLTNIAGVLQQMKTQVEVIGWTWVVASRQEDGVPRTSILGRPVTDFVHRSGRPGSQRRRTGRV